MAAGLIEPVRSGNGLSYRDLIAGFRKLELDPQVPYIAHASLSAFGRINGGAETLLGAVLACFPRLMAPTFTYATMLVPETGPENNAIQYGSAKDNNRMAEFFHPDLPADRLMGALAEALRRHPRAQRSAHPILSFAGVGVDAALRVQNLEEPLAPIRALGEEEGWVLLLGVNHTTNTSIHFAEQTAGRRGFVRWALTPRGAKACPRFPGCSDGFEAIVPHLEGSIREVQVGGALAQAVPLGDLVRAVTRKIAQEPEALLCGRPNCPRCDEYRRRARADAG
jgi:aminoglycoside 3-N-acetyltransferase